MSFWLRHFVILNVPSQICDHQLRIPLFNRLHFDCSWSASLIVKILVMHSQFRSFRAPYWSRHVEFGNLMHAAFSSQILATALIWLTLNVSYILHHNIRVNIDHGNKNSPESFGWKFLNKWFDDLEVKDNISVNMVYSFYLFIKKTTKFYHTFNVVKYLTCYTWFEILTKLVENPVHVIWKTSKLSFMHKTIHWPALNSSIYRNKYWFLNQVFLSSKLIGSKFKLLVLLRSIITQMNYFKLKEMLKNGIC